MLFRPIAPILLAILLVPAAARADHVVTTAPDVLRRIVPLVEDACGAKFEKAPVVRELSGDAAKRLFMRDVRPELERRYRGVNAGQMRYLMEVAATSSVRSCVARYSFSGEAIILVRSGFDRQRRAVGLPEDQAGVFLVAALAHECVHALDDARFDLEKLFRATKDEEALRTVNMIAEGRAVYFGRRVAAILRVPDAIRNRLPGGDAPEGAREWRFALTYRHGLEFVENLVKRKGIPLADRALREPPAITHFVCQPHRWPDGKSSDRTPRNRLVLEKLGEPRPSTRMSELMLRIRYATLHGPEVARALFANYRDGVQVVVGESNVAALEFANTPAAARYAERSREEPMVEVLFTEGDSVVLRVSGRDAADVAARLRDALDASKR